MAAVCLTTLTEQWIRDRLQLKHPFLGDVRTLSLPGTHEEKIRHLGNALNNFCRLKSLDLSYNAIVSLEGVKHLKKLERLILYYNCVPSLEKVQVLYGLPVLRELDLRLNPLTKNCPGYRPHLVHAMPSLRKLGKTCSRCPHCAHHRPGYLFIKCSHSFMIFLLQIIFQSETRSAKLQYLSSPLNIPLCSTAASLAESKDSQMNTLPHNLSSTSPKGAERPKVSFGPVFEKHKTLPGKQKQNDSSSWQFSLLIGTLNLGLFHVRLIIFADISAFPSQGGYRKPLEMLLNLVDKHWRGERSLHHNNSFLCEPKMNVFSSDLFLAVAQAVQILSMMESNISSREAEVRTLRQDVNKVVHELTVLIQGKLNEQLRIVLEENVALQKQLIKLERQYLKSMMKSSPVTQIRGGEPENTVAKLGSVCVICCLCLYCRSLVATNECLLAELRATAEH
uniref:Centrosomal protein 72 n=1 Tax=Xiphophorus couchianus TaxID=32473 RepID=A0A3B5N099_9TELE